MAKQASDSQGALGRYLATIPTLADGEWLEALLDSRGGLVGVIKDGRAGGTTLAGVYGSSVDAFSPGGALSALASSLLFNGVTWDRARTPNVFKPIQNVAVTAGTPVSAWTPAAGKKFRLMGFMLSLSVAGRILLKDNGTEIFRTGDLAAGVGQSTPPLGNGILSAVANQVLQIDASASGSVNGVVFGTEE